MTAPRIVTSVMDAGPYSIWLAWDDRLGADASPFGEGRTEAEAVADLQRQLEEDA